MTSTDPVTPAPVPGPGPVAAAGPSAGPTPAASAAPTAGASSSAGASAAPIPGKDTSLVTEETDKLEFRDPEQPNLHVVYWTRPGATPPSHGARILLWNHGICEHSGRYRGIAAEVLARVAALDAVAAYDMRGHGMSAGPRGKIASELDLEADLAQHVLPAVAMRFGEAPSIVLAGHSLGGLVVAGVTSGPDPLVANEMGALAGVVLSAPAIEVIVPGIVNKMLAPLAGIVNRIPGARCMTKPAGIPPAHLSHCEEEVKAFVDDPKTFDTVSFGVAGDMLTRGSEIIQTIPKIPNCVLNSVPVMVIHGAEDTVTKLSGSRRLAHVIADQSVVRMITVRGARHEIHNELMANGRGQFFDELCAFVTEAFKEK